MIVSPVEGRKLSFLMEETFQVFSESDILATCRRTLWPKACYMHTALCIKVTMDREPIEVPGLPVIAAARLLMGSAALAAKFCNDSGFWLPVALHASQKLVCDITGAHI